MTSTTTLAEAFAAKPAAPKRRKATQQQQPARRKFRLGDSARPPHRSGPSAETLRATQELNERHAAERSRMREAIQSGGRLVAQQQG